MKVGNFTKFNIVLVAAVLALFLGNVPAFAEPCDTCGCSSCSTSETAMSTSKDGNTIVDIAVSDGSFNTLVTAVKAAGLVDTLSGKGPFTVFAPTDEAFAKIPKRTLNNLLKPENVKDLRAILTYHVVPGRVLASDVVKLSSAATANGQTISVRFDKNKKKVFIDDAQVLKTDIEASNGVIHVIDSVIMPKDIVDIAATSGSFNTLVAAVKAAGLVDTLKGKGPFTVFAPTDEAFAKIPKETLNSLLKPENKSKLQAILTYHVVPRELMAERVVKADSARTVNGKSLGFKVRKGGVYVDNAKVVKTDIKANNGIIHVIDTVLIPQ
jgi:uncharacterized surface protein with fasciclin (FAS1) repeats